VTTALGRQGSSKEFIASCNSVEQNNDGKIRRLMPIECSRLMGLPDNYLDFGNYDGIIKELKDGSKYKLAGNGFHVDVVAYILNFIPK
jgi:DNA (cytosine-5)-methyltransferase 1